MVSIMSNIEPDLSKLSEGAKKGVNPPAGFTPRPGQVVCGDIDMRIDSQGQWYYQGSPFKRQELVKLFSTVLTRDEDGDHWLITPAEMCRIEVDDAPFMAVELLSEGDNGAQIIRFRTNIDQLVTLDENHPLRVEINPDSGEPSPYIALDKGLEAKLSRPVFYELVERGNPEDINGEQIYGIWSQGHFFAIQASPELAT
jgi:uncharacterized protein